MNRFEKLKSQGQIQAGSCASMVSENYPSLPSINYFLSLHGIPCFDAKKNKFLRRHKDLPENNSREVEFAAQLAEFEAMLLIDKDLGLTIVGLEQSAPGFKNDCDIVAKLNGTDTFFEVKNRSKDHTRKPPEALLQTVSEAVCEAGLPFDAWPEWFGKKEGFTGEDATSLKLAMTQHIEHFLKRNNRTRKNLRPLYWPKEAEVDRSKTQVIVYFDQGQPTSNRIGYLADVDLIDDYRSYILGTGKTGSNGKEMSPMAHEAEKKGADYLVCRVAGWPYLGDMVERCFQLVQRLTPFVYYSCDPRLGAMSGILLFTSHNKFLVVNNSNAKKRNWIKV